MPTAPIPHLAAASLTALFLLASVMFMAMLAGIEPHPPGARGPYLGAVAALSVASVWLLLAGHRLGRWIGTIAALAYLPSVGPHKFFTEPAAQSLAPLILVGTLAVIATVISLNRPNPNGA
jgi:hypothetical protein